MIRDEVEPSGGSKPIPTILDDSPIHTATFSGKNVPALAILAAMSLGGTQLRRINLVGWDDESLPAKWRDYVDRARREKFKGTTVLRWLTKDELAEEDS